MSVAAITVTLMTAAVIPLRSAHEPVAARRARPPGAGGARALHRARLRPDHRRGDRRPGGPDGADVLPALRRQTGSVVRWTGRADRVVDDAHRAGARVRFADRRGGPSVAGDGRDARGASRTRPSAP